jgi:hypothetical protein
LEDETAEMYEAVFHNGGRYNPDTAEQPDQMHHQRFAAAERKDHSSFLQLYIEYAGFHDLNSFLYKSRTVS